MWAGVECDLIPTSPGPGAKPTRDRRKEPKVWLAGELIVRCEYQDLAKLPSQLFIKTTLRTLVLTGNALTSIPPEITHLKELRELKLGYNQLPQLPDEICSLSNLKHLDVQYNQLQDVPSALCRLVHLAMINLDGNPLSPSIQAVWASAAGEPLAAAAADASNGDTGQQKRQTVTSAKAPGRQAAAAANRILKERTQALLQHILQQQDPAAVMQIKQAKLQLLQQASTAQIVKLLCVADPDSLAHCLSIATTAGLSSDLVQRIQQAQTATADMQQALDTAQALQLGHNKQSDSSPGGESSAHEQLAAALRQFESLCKPRRPAGSVYVSAHATWRALQRQMLEHGWRCNSPNHTAVLPSTGGIGSAAATSSAVAESITDSGSISGLPTGSPVGGRRYMTLPEQARQRLEAAGAKTFAEWAAEKEKREQTERQHIVDLAQQEAKFKAQLVADRAAKAIDNCGREKQWRSKVVEPFPHGTFSLSAEQLKAVRRAYRRPPDLQAPDSD